MEIDEIEHHLHAEPVRLGHERLQVVLRAVFGIDGKEILLAVGVPGIVQAACFLASAPETLVRVVVRKLVRREVDDVHAVRLKVGEFHARGGEGSFWREHAREHLVHDASAQKLRHGTSLCRPCVVCARVRGMKPPFQAFPAIWQPHKRDRSVCRDSPYARLLFSGNTVFARHGSRENRHHANQADGDDRNLNPVPHHNVFQLMACFL